MKISITSELPAARTSKPGFRLDAHALALLDAPERLVAVPIEAIQYVSRRMEDRRRQRAMLVRAGAVLVIGLAFWLGTLAGNARADILDVLPPLGSIQEQLLFQVSAGSWCAAMAALIYGFVNHKS